MSILSGFKKYKNFKANANGDHQLQSFWTSTDTVEDANGNTLTSILANLPNPMVMRGTVGAQEDNPTVTALPVDGSATIGDTYKVITDGTYDSVVAKIGDFFTCITKTSSVNTWSHIPAGDDSIVIANPQGTVTDNLETVSIDGVIYSVKDGNAMIKGVDYVTAGRKSGTTAGEKTTAEGYETTASYAYAHAEGQSSVSSGQASHAEGYGGTASGNYSHVEGESNTASGRCAHAEGNNTSASSNYTHTEGRNTTASDQYAHAEGFGTIASSETAHAENCYTTASGFASHAEGLYTIASQTHQHVQGKYNIEDENGRYAHIVGGGTSDSNRKNIHTLDWYGNAKFAGEVEDGNGNKLSDFKGSQTVTGNPIALTDGSETYAEELSVDLEPVQSGSGTPSPSNIRPIQGYDIVSVDRCGKNLFNGVLTNGIVNTGGSYSTAATRVTNVSQTVDSKLKLTSGSYTISSTTLNDCTVVIKSDSGAVLQDLAASWHSLPYTFTVNQDGYLYFTCRKTNNPSINIDGQIIQVEEGSTATTYEPYNGQTVSCQLGNKNLLPMTVEGIKAANSGATWSGNVCTINGVTFTILTDENGLVTGIKANGTATETAALNVWYTNSSALTFNSENLYLSVNSEKGCGIKVNGSWVGVSTAGDYLLSSVNSITELWIGAGVSTVFDNAIYKPMLRYSYISDSTFSPYNPTLGGMVYGATVDVANGVMVVDNGYKTFNGSENWQLAWEGTRVYYETNSLIANGKVEYSAAGVQGISDKYVWLPFDTNNSIWTQRTSNIEPYGAFSIRNNGYVYIKDINCVDANALKTYLASNPLQVCYELATPITYHLTPAQLKLLKGYNYISSNGTTIHLTYQPDNVIAEPKADVQRLRDDVDDRLVGNACRNLVNVTGRTITSQTYLLQNYEIEAGTYTVSFKAKNNSDIVAYFNVTPDNSVLDTYTNYRVNIPANSALADYSVTFTIPFDMIISMLCNGASSGYNFDVDRIQLERGSFPTAYEEYYPSNKELWEMIKALQNI